MAFAKRKFGKKKSSFTRVGNMFKSKHPKEGMKYQYYTTCDGKYLESVAEVIANAAESGQPIVFNFTKWNDSEHPVLTVSPGKANDSKRITKKQDDSAEDIDGDNTEDGL